MLTFLPSEKRKKFKALFESMKKKGCFGSSAHDHYIYIFLKNLCPQTPNPKILHSCCILIHTCSPTTLPLHPLSKGNYIFFPLWSTEQIKYFFFSFLPFSSYCCKENTPIHRPSAWAKMSILFTFACISLWPLYLFLPLERWVARIKVHNMSFAEKRLKVIV